MEIVSVMSEDWNAIYVNGEKLVEGHSVNWEWFIRLLMEKGLITYNLHEYELTDDAVEKILKWNFPEKVSEFPKRLKIK